jgi:pimeloyl-ACP methyl ester carboxylesterase
MFRDLIPRLAGKYHVIAPDHLGFGYSAMPPADSFEYSIAALASLTIAFTEKLGLTSYAIFVQDYGAPIGWRMALEHPERTRRSSSRTATPTRTGSSKRSGQRWWRTTPHHRPRLRLERRRCRARRW